MAHSVNHLSEGCFSACPHLSEMQISSKVSEIPPSAFKEDRKLRQVDFADNSLLLKIREDAFNECASLAYIKIPESVIDIGDRAFYRCKSLSRIEFPKTLERIGKEAFYFCGMEELHLPESLEVLEESAFFKCTKLTEVCLPESIRYIGKWVFHGCNRLRTLEIRHDPEYIGPWIINKSAKIRCYQGSKVDAYCQESGFEVEYL